MAKKIPKIFNFQLLNTFYISSQRLCRKMCFIDKEHKYLLCCLYNLKKALLFSKHNKLLPKRINLIQVYFAVTNNIL